MGEEEQCATLQLLAHESDVPGVHIGAQRFVMQRIALIPHRDESECHRRCIQHRTIPDNRERGVAEAGQQRPVAVWIGLACVEMNDPIRRQHGPQGTH